MNAQLAASIATWPQEVTELRRPKVVERQKIFFSDLRASQLRHFLRPSGDGSRELRVHESYAAKWRYGSSGAPYMSNAIVGQVADGLFVVRSTTGKAGMTLRPSGELIPKIVFNLFVRPSGGNRIETILQGYRLLLLLLQQD